MFSESAAEVFPDLIRIAFQWLHFEPWESQGRILDTHKLKQPDPHKRWEQEREISGCPHFPFVHCLCVHIFLAGIHIFLYYIFSTANRELVAAGLLADPKAPG